MMRLLSCVLGCLILPCLLGCPNPRRELEEVEKQIEVAEKELAKLKAKAAELRAQIQDDGPATPQSDTFEALVASIPEEARPKDRFDTIRRERANKWMAENAVGQPIKSRYVVREVGVAAENGKFIADVYIDTKVQLNAHDWNVRFTSADGGFSLRYPGLDDPTAERLEELKKQKVVLAGTITEATFSITGDLIVRLEEVSFDGQSFD